MMILPDSPDDGSASKRLFFKRYLVKAPRSLTMTEEEIRLYGQRVTGIKQLDSYLANEMITGRVPVVEMARIVSEGGCVSFCNKFDTIECYKDIHQHMVNWEYLLTNNYNIKRPPLEDFNMLKEFQDALEVYSGLFDRVDNNHNPMGKLSQLSGKDFRRKRSTPRTYLNGLNRHSSNDVEVIEITSWDQVQRLNRSLP